MSGECQAGSARREGKKVQYQAAQYENKKCGTLQSDASIYQKSVSKKLRNKRTENQ